MPPIMGQIPMQQLPVVSPQGGVTGPAQGLTSNPNAGIQTAMLTLNGMVEQHRKRQFEDQDAAAKRVQQQLLLAQNGLPVNEKSFWKDMQKAGIPIDPEGQVVQQPGGGTQLPPPGGGQQQGQMQQPQGPPPQALQAISQRNMMQQQMMSQVAMAKGKHEMGMLGLYQKAAQGGPEGYDAMITLSTLENPGQFSSFAAQLRMERAYGKSMENVIDDMMNAQKAKHREEAILTDERRKKFRADMAGEIGKHLKDTFDQFPTVDPILAKTYAEEVTLNPTSQLSTRYLEMIKSTSMSKAQLAEEIRKNEDKFKQAGVDTAAMNARTNRMREEREERKFAWEQKQKESELTEIDKKEIRAANTATWNRLKEMNMSDETRYQMILDMANDQLLNGFEQHAAERSWVGKIFKGPTDAIGLTDPGTEIKSNQAKLPGLPDQVPPAPWQWSAQDLVNQRNLRYDPQQRNLGQQHQLLNPQQQHIMRYMMMQNTGQR